MLDENGNITTQPAVLHYIVTDSTGRAAHVRFDTGRNDILSIDTGQNDAVPGYVFHSDFDEWIEFYHSLDLLPENERVEMLAEFERERMEAIWDFWQDELESDYEPWETIPDDDLTERQPSPIELITGVSYYGLTGDELIDATQMIRDFFGPPPIRITVSYGDID